MGLLVGVSQADLSIDFGPGTLQTGFTPQSNTDTTYNDVLYGTVDVRVDEIVDDRK